MYQRADRLLKRIQTILKKEAITLENTGIDELHSLGVEKVTKKLLKRLKKRNEESFLEVAYFCYLMAIEVANQKGYEGNGDVKSVGKEWLKTFLNKYNIVTNYLYEPECERKRLRLSEALGTAILYGDNKVKRDNIKRFFNLWYTQTSQYMIDVVDEVETKAWTDLGVEYAMWVTERDERVCEQCNSLDGKVFKLSEFPHKQHYRCRCRKVPINANKNNKE